MQTSTTSSLYPLINTYAMRNGIYLGIWAIAYFVTSGASLIWPVFQIFSLFLFCGSPFFAAWLTFRFRNNAVPTTRTFTFAHGFLYTFLIGLYASIWMAVFVFIYLKYFDGGFIFDAYSRQLQSPEMQQALQMSGNNILHEIGGVKGLVDSMRSITPSSYTSTLLTLSLLPNPIISAIIAFACKRDARPPEIINNH